MSAQELEIKASSHRTIGASKRASVRETNGEEEMRREEAGEEVCWLTHKECALATAAAQE